MKKGDTINTIEDFFFKVVSTTMSLVATVGFGSMVYSWMNEMKV